jgi:hypothetical protein
LSEYLGGYATYNFSGAVAAASLGTNDPLVGTGGTPTKIPGQYIPVGQGFFVVADNTGTINFNNGQRIFKKEGGDSVFLSPNDNSVDLDFKQNSSNISLETRNNIEDTRTKLRIGFNSINTIHRQLLVTVDSIATMEYDWAFDGVINENQIDDMYWMINDKKYVIQGIGEIEEETVLPLGIHTNIQGINSITIDALENVNDDLLIFLHDKELGIYHDLRTGDYDVFLDSGEYLERFEITFTNNDQLSISENELVVFDVHYTNSIESIVIVNPNLHEIKTLELFNILSQSIYKNDDVLTESYSKFKLSGLSSGTYIIKIETNESKIITKKVLVK